MPNLYMYLFNVFPQTYRGFDDGIDHLASDAE